MKIPFLFPVNPEGLDEIARALLENTPPPAETPPQPQDSFYQLDKSKIIQATTPEYRAFLREANYADIDSCNGLLVAKNILRIDPNVRTIAQSNNIPISGNDNDYLVSINHPNSRALVQALGYRLLTAGLMYNLFIPFIKDQAQQDQEAKATLDEMTSTKAEWLEDLILNKNTLRIGAKQKQLTLPQKDGKFDKQDLNGFGYPNNLHENGGFRYWYPRDNERAVFRNRYSELILYLNREPSIGNGDLGVRLAKFF